MSRTSRTGGRPNRLCGPELSAYVEHTIAELKALAPEIVIPMHCTGRAFLARLRTEMPDRLIDWNTGSRFTFGV